MTGISKDIWYEMSSKEFNLEIGRDKTDSLKYIETHFRNANFGSYMGLNFGFDRLYRELFLTKAFDRYLAKNPDFMRNTSAL